jgi:hypothetical protein
MQLQKEAEEKAVPASTQQSAVAPALPRTKEGSPSKVVKLLRSDPSIRSPSGTQHDKKPKISEQRTYAHATSSLIRLAIVPMAYPDRKFEDEKFVLLKRSIKGRILDLVTGTKAPIFQGTSNRDGEVIFNCFNKETLEWLISVMTVLSIKEGLQLCAL